MLREASGIVGAEENIGCRNPCLTVEFGDCYRTNRWIPVMFVVPTELFRLSSVV